MPSGAAIIARRLAEAGCRHAFGIPGGEVLALMEGLKEAGIAFHLCKHENAGGFMAEGTYHATGAPAVLLATVGPGVANAINVVANAQQDRVPMIFLTGAVDPADTHTYTHQVFDHGKVLASLVKASFRLEPGAIDVIIDKAVAIATDGRPGPVHIDVPIKVANGNVKKVAATRRVRPAPMAPANTRILRDVQAGLARAERPLMIVGMDVLHQGGTEAVRDFLRQLPMPVITTYKAKGVLPEDDPLCLGAAGLSPKADDILLPFIKECDFILLVGYDPIEMRVGWRNPWASDVDVVEISAEANTHYVHQATASFIGHIGTSLRRLRRDVVMGPAWPKKEPQKLRKKLKGAFSSKGKWGAIAIVEAVRAALPRDGVVTVDTGAHRIVQSQTWEAYGPSQALQSTGLCTMGTALPLALGYKLAKPQTPVVAFTGDAGLEMILGELATARDMKLPVVIVVFVDEQLALIEVKQRREGYPNLGVDFGGTNFAAVAKAMGGKGVVADTADKVSRAVKRGLKAETFTLIACPIWRNAYDGKF